MNKFIFTLLLFVFSQQSFAHKTSDSYLNVTKTEQQTVINWSIAVRDLEYAVGLDVNVDNKIVWSEVLQRKQDIEAYVLSRLLLYRVKGESRQLCEIENKSLLVDDKTDGSYIVFNVVSPCLLGSLGETLEIDYQLLFDIDKNHRGLILFKTENNVFTQVAGPDDHVFIFNEKDESPITILFRYIIEGVWHILIGLDHILFLLVLLLPSVLNYEKGRWQQRGDIRSSYTPIIKLVTAFTVAHSITLTLSVLKIVQPPSQLVEVVIALTVLLTCLHILKPVFKFSLWKMAFVFGLVHGFGFANVLQDLGLQETALALSLFGFNIGVEIGQLFIVCLFIAFASVAHKYWWYRDYVFKGGITATALISCVWIVERLFNYEVLGI